MVERYKLYYWIFVVTFWVTYCWGFVAEEFCPPLTSVSNAVTTLGEFTIFALGIITVRKTGDVVILVSYFVLAFLSTIMVNHIPVGTMINGTREFVGLLCVVPILRYFLTSEYRAEFRRKMDRQLEIWLWIQAFCVTEQFLRYGANDHGGGSMGNGSSGLVSMSIYFISFYLVSRRWDADNYFRSLKENIKYIILLYPSFLNETKISFILFVCYFALLMKFDKRLLLKTIYIVPASAIALVGVGWAYFEATEQDADRVLSEEFFTDYLYGADLGEVVDMAIMVQTGEMEVDPSQWWTVDVPRFAKLVLISPILEEEPGGTLLGAGVGQFKGAASGSQTRFAKMNQWVLNATRPMLFEIFVQLGYLGLVWYFCTICYRLFTRNRRHPLSRQIQVLFGVATFVMLFYNQAFAILQFCLTAFYITTVLKYWGNGCELDSDGEEPEKKLNPVETK